MQMELADIRLMMLMILFIICVLFKVDSVGSKIFLRFGYRFDVIVFDSVCFI